MANVDVLLARYEDELKGVVNEIKITTEKIQELDKKGLELTTYANVLSGKIEALKEIKESEGKNYEE